MWQHYKRRFWSTQIFILMLISIGRFGLNMTGKELLAIFIAMQVGAFLGAWLAVKIKRQGTDLPLSRR